MTAIAHAYPAMPAIQANAWRQFFATAEHVHAQTTFVAEHVSGDSATVDVDLRLRYAYHGGGPANTVTRYRATLARRRGAWELETLAPVER